MDHLAEGEEANLGVKTSSVYLHFALKQDYETRNLPKPIYNVVVLVETPVNGQITLRFFVPEYI